MWGSGCRAGSSRGCPCPVGSQGWAVLAVGKVPGWLPWSPPIPAFPTHCSRPLLDVGEAVVALQGRGDADGSVHAQGVFLQAAGGRRVRQHQPGTCGHRERMRALGAAPCSGFALLRTTGLAIPRSSLGECLECSWPRLQQDTHLSRRRLRFTLSALATALAPAKPREFPRRLQTNKGSREQGQPGVGPNGRSDHTASPGTGLGDHHARVAAMLSQGPGSQTAQGSVALPWAHGGPMERLLQDLQALVDLQGFCQGLGTGRTN